MKTRREVKFRHVVARVAAKEVRLGDFILIDIGPDRNPQTGFYSKVMRISRHQDGAFEFHTQDQPRVLRPFDMIAYLRPLQKQR